MSTLKQLARRNGFLYVLYHLPRLFKGYAPLFLDYPVNPKPRYGYGLPPHPQLQEMFCAQAASFERVLRNFLRFEPELLRIPVRAAKNVTEPCWMNKWFSGLDTVALYSLVAGGNPQRCVEIGSGQSTKVIRRAIGDHHLRTRLTSIDPHPRAEIDALCDAVIRQPLEEADLSLLRELSAGDMLFFDGSHRSFMNSDVTVFFLEILPALQPGVLVHLHDIHLPDDYPRERAEWHYSEQYLLATSLLAGHAGYEVVLPNAFVCNSPDLRRVLDPLWTRPELRGVPREGLSFWLRTR
jgi:hypothetical protein